MANREPKISIPVDTKGLPINRAMGLPLFNKPTLGSATKYIPIFDFSALNFQTRVFTGFSIENQDAASRIELAYAQDINDAPIKFMDIGPLQFFTVDNLTYGPGIQDDSTGKLANYIFARLDVPQGTMATGTITYAGNPADGSKLNINGFIYEFSDDTSKNPSSDVRVDLGATEDVTYQNLVNAANAFDPSVTLSINTGTNVVTITSNLGGTDGNAIVISDVSTGATFSGATLSGGAGGVAPYIHIW